MTIGALATEHSRTDQSHGSRNNVVSRTVEDARSTQFLSQAEGSSVGGHTVAIQAGHDVNVVGILLASITPVLGPAIANKISAWAEESASLQSGQRANSAVNQKDIEVLTANGVKFTPQNVVATGTTPAGQVVFLETGNPRAGLQHIVERHAADFASIGVTESQIPSVVMKAVTEGTVVGYQGRDTGRPIYMTTINGQPQRIAVTIGSNGFIVGANPAGGGQ